MTRTDLILLHAPSVYDFRKRSALFGPISDVVPSTPIFEMYPIGFLTILVYLKQHGFRVRIVNIALQMLRKPRFNVEKLIRSLDPVAFGIDLHWLPHAQGSLAIAGLVKKYHPDTPVIMGGASASYFHRELMDYPQVDYVIRGDSAEEPLRLLLERIRQQADPTPVPNLTWRDTDGTIKVNRLTHVKQDLNDLSFDYRNIIKSTIRYQDIFGHLPFRRWFTYPIVGLLPLKGCIHNCITCGGSRHFQGRTCGRNALAVRDPGLMARDIKLISGYLNGPIMILDDIRQAGPDYADRFFSKLQNITFDNHIALELFGPADRSFFRKAAAAVKNFNIQMSPESHDEQVRRAFGKHYSNQELEQTIREALAAGCRRVDLFFMTGLPYQTPESVQGTVRYWDDLLKQFAREEPDRFHIYISPLAPFLDPGSRAFEEPGKYGYRLFYRTLEEHRQALLSPSWKYMLNYETKWMSRDQIVESTYSAALALNRLNLQYGIIRKKEAVVVERRIQEAQELIRQVDAILSSNQGELAQKELQQLDNELALVTHGALFKKGAMQWPVKVSRFRVSGIIRAALARL